MKKQTLKNLALNKKTVSKLDREAKIMGGAPNSFLCFTIAGCETKSNIFVCCPQEPEPVPFSVFPRCNSNHGACPM
ncbi:hypothetical protein [Kordia sp.]|jgi:hypothetical protein|uniref:hypothetical protein n=1 Tax=Kordia sp. TaxID=1965332 RepID=UPI003D6AFFE1